MRKLLMKEIRLAMHPVTPIMLALSAMVFIPNYPYSVIFFYMSLALFFTCLMGRENHDVIYTLTLPVAKRDVVKGRMALAVMLQLSQLLLAALLGVLRLKLYSAPNEAGMDLGISLLAEGLLLIGIFNIVFFTNYYRDVRKEGVSFVIAAIVFFVLVVVEVCATYAAPFVRDVLDTPDPAHMGEKLLALAVGAAAYVGLTWAAYRVSVKRFERLDL